MVAEAITAGGILSEAQAQAERLSVLLAEMGMAYKLAVVDPRSLKPLERNAHFMKRETFQALVRNIKKDRGLSSIPFCWKDPEGTYHTLSGNHRVEAAIQAEVPFILILYDDTPLSRQERVAIQLSHNAIVGQDDPATLKDLWKEIEDVGLKLYSGLDDKGLKELAGAATAALTEVRLDYRTLTFVFLAEEVEQLSATLDAALERIQDRNPVYLARLQEFDALLDALARLRKEHQIKSASLGLLAILDQFNQSRECPACSPEKKKSSE